MEASLHGWRDRHPVNGLVGAVVFLVGAAVVLVFLAVAAVVGLVAIAVVAVVMAVERLVALLVPSSRRRPRRVTVPDGLVRMVRFGSGPSRVIEARSYELPHDAPGR